MNITNPRIQVWYWHGDNLKPHQKKKLEDMGMYTDGNYRYINMTLSEFVEKWQDNVLILSPNNYRKEWLVGVTGYHNFNRM